MILPSSTLAALLLLAISLLCWGSWANTQKAAGKWRFELYYYDFSLGALLLIVIAAFTLGSLNGSELSFQDNFLIAGYRKMVWALAAGVVFNAANMLLAGAVSVAGMSVAFALSAGVSIVFGTGWDLAFNNHGSALLLVTGAALILVALVLSGFAFGSYLDTLLEASKKAGMQLDPRSRTAKARPASPKAAPAIVLGILSGIVMGFYRPMLALGAEGDNGVAPYGLALLFAGGAVISTFVLAPFFLNFPVNGAPARFGDYFRGTMKEHFMGLLGGMIWAVGLVASVVAAAVPGLQRPSPALRYALGHGDVLVAILCGLLLWGEFKKADSRTQTMCCGVVLLFLVGLAVLSLGAV
jgi:glucose uptake protein